MTTRVMLYLPLLVALPCFFILPVVVHGWNNPYTWWSRRRQRRPLVVTFDPETTTQMDRDVFFMKRALEQAKLAATQGEVPIGAIVVEPISLVSSDNNHTNNPYHYQIISQQHNRVEQWYDASAHAELLALRDAGCKKQNWRLPQHTTLYCTLEPCPICLSSAQAFRIDRIVYGAPDIRLGALGSFVNLLDHNNNNKTLPHPYHTIANVTGGILAVECGDLLRTFFRQRRQQQQQPSRGKKRQ